MRAGGLGEIKKPAGRASRFPVLPDVYCVVEALLDAFEASLLAVLAGGLAGGIGSCDGEAAWDGIGVGAAAGCGGVASVAACAVDASAGAGVLGADVVGAGVVGSVTLGAAETEALGAVTATSAEALDELGSGSFVALLPLLTDAVTLFELAAWREVFVSFFSFAGFAGFSIAVAFDSTGGVGFTVSTLAALGAVSALVSSMVVVEVVELAARLVSARLVCGFATLAVRAGFAGASWPTRWSSTTAPPMATAVMTPNAMPKWFTFFSSWL